MDRFYFYVDCSCIRNIFSSKKNFQQYNKQKYSKKVWIVGYVSLIRKWVRMFKETASTTDKSMSAQPKSSRTDENVESV